MIPAAARATLRAKAEGNMPDTWRCERGGKRTFDEATGKYVVTQPTVVYDGRARLDDRSTIGQRTAALGELTVQSSLLLSLPVKASAGIRVGDVLTCTAAADDDAMVGVAVRVSDLHLQTQSTERKLPVEVESWPTT